jgi:NADH-quinone oxidoreductase subunit C
MTDESKNLPHDSSETKASDKDDESRPAETSSKGTDDKAPSSPDLSAEGGTLPTPEGTPPTPESQAALTGKAPSGSSTSGTTVPASSSSAETESASSVPPKPKPTAPPANETPEEKKARLERIIAEAKAKKEAAAAAAQGEGGEATSSSSSAPTPPGGKSPEVGDPAKSPSQADLERAAKIAEAKARAAALKEAAASKAPTAAPAKPTPTAAAGAGVPKPPVKKKDEGPKPTDASTHPLVKRLRERTGDAVTNASTFLGQLSIQVKPDSIVAVCLALRDDALTPFNYLSDLTCVHYPERDEAPFEVVYNLYSISKNERVRVKAAAGDEGIESVTSVWPAANWMEREVFDLFGVQFKNHPDMRRLLLPQDWDGHPLRKDYPLEFMENEWTARHLTEFTEVQREQLEQRRAYGLEILQTPDERRLRELFRDSRDPLPKEHK